MSGKRAKALRKMQLELARVIQERYRQALAELAKK